MEHIHSWKFDRVDVVWFERERQNGKDDPYAQHTVKITYVCQVEDCNAKACEYGKTTTVLFP